MTPTVRTSEVVLVHTAHALTEVFSNDAEFLAVKHKLVRDFINSGGFAEVKSGCVIMPAKGHGVPTIHFQHALVHGFGMRSVFPGAFAKEVSVLIDRITFIEKCLNRLRNDQECHLGTVTVWFNN